MRGESRQSLPTDPLTNDVTRNLRAFPRSPALPRSYGGLRRIFKRVTSLSLSRYLSLSLFLFLVRIPGREVRFGRVIQLSVSCFRAQHSALLRASA